MKNMKTKILFLLSFAVLVMASCKKEKAELGEPFSRLDGLKGTWILDKVIQIDDNSPVKANIELSKHYMDANPDSIIQLTFNSDNSFQVTYGKGKNYFAGKKPSTYRGAPETGNFELQNSLYSDFSSTAPDYVRLITSNSDTVSCRLLNPVRSHDNNLGLQITRCKISYNYYFKRKN